MSTNSTDPLAGSQCCHVALYKINDPIQQTLSVGAMPTIVPNPMQILNIHSAGSPTHTRCGIQPVPTPHTVFQSAYRVWEGNKVLNKVSTSLNPVFD